MLAMNHSQWQQEGGGMAAARTALCRGRHLRGENSDNGSVIVPYCKECCRLEGRHHGSVIQVNCNYK